MSSAFFTTFEGSKGVYLKPKKNFPAGRTRAAGTFLSASLSDSGVIIRGPLSLSAHNLSKVDNDSLVSVDSASRVHFLDLLR